MRINPKKANYEKTTRLYSSTKYTLMFSKDFWRVRGKLLRG